MRQQKGWVVLLGSALFLVCGCDQAQRGDAVDNQEPSAGAYRSEAKRTVGWDQLRIGQDPVEVLSLLNEPMDIKVTSVSTHWFYSNRGAEGPHVAFDTRTMKVERWRAPASR